MNMSMINDVQNLTKEIQSCNISTTTTTTSTIIYFFVTKRVPPNICTQDLRFKLTLIIPNSYIVLVLGFLSRHAHMMSETRRREQFHSRDSTTTARQQQSPLSLISHFFHLCSIISLTPSSNPGSIKHMYSWTTSWVTMHGCYNSLQQRFGDIKLYLTELPHEPNKRN